MSHVFLVLGLAYAFGINLATYAAWAHDKSRAVRGARRIPEQNLLTLAFLGGWPAALLASQTVKHKRRKLGFMVKLYAISALQVIFVAVIFLWEG